MKKLIFRMTTAMAFVFLFWSAGATFAQEQQQQQPQKSCSKTTDAEIVAAVKAQFENDEEIKAQMSHVNISVKKRVVTLEGWIGGEGLLEKAVVLAQKTRCVRSVKNRLKKSGGGSCGPRQRPCGDICIDKRSECTIGG